MKAMILAAGFGRRLLPLTKQTPKPLLRVGNETLLERNINHLTSNGFSEIIINVSYLGELITEFVEKKYPTQKILFSIEDKPLGTGGAILNALDKIGDEPFLLLNSDIYHNIDIKDLPKYTAAAHLIGVPNPDHNLNGDFSIDKDVIYIKKDKTNDLTWSGVSLINPNIFKDTNFNSDTFSIWDVVLPKYIAQGQVTGQKSEEFWIDVGTHERLNLLNSAYNGDQ